MKHRHYLSIIGIDACLIFFFSFNGRSGNHSVHVLSAYLHSGLQASIKIFFFVRLNHKAEESFCSEAKSFVA